LAQTKPIGPELLAAQYISVLSMGRPRTVCWWLGIKGLELARTGVDLWISLWSGV